MPTFNEMQAKDQDIEFIVDFPETDDTPEQDEEWCWVSIRHRKKIRFHDYNKIYTIPGLYEHIFYEKLKCNSPEVVCGQFEEAIKQDGFDPAKLHVLDVGAGNGMVGERLQQMGAKALVGIDIIEEAKLAAERDRPHVYQDYFAEDLTNLSPEAFEKLDSEPFNCLATVAALGFGDIPPAAFTQAFNFIESPGWCAFNIKDSFMNDNDTSGFCGLIQKMNKEGVIDIRGQRRYSHRVSIDGTPLHYIAIAAKKNRDVPVEWLKEFE